MDRRCWAERSCAKGALSRQTEPRTAPSFGLEGAFVSVADSRASAPGKWNQPPPTTTSSRRSNMSSLFASESWWLVGNPPIGFGNQPSGGSCGFQASCVGSAW